MKRGAVLVVLGSLAGACATAGSSWMDGPLPGEERDDEHVGSVAPPRDSAGPSGPMGVHGRSIGGDDEGTDEDDPPSPTPSSSAAARPLEGRVLGTFRNTYYDFPAERDFEGDTAVALKTPKCVTIKDVPRAFFEAVCVQGSGMLSTGTTVSFAKRDCKCAETCPRTSQKICYDALDATTFPFGRGATGKPITPLYTVAVDSGVIPLGTALYIPEYDGLPRDESKSEAHDGCFVAQDRGVRVQGQHVDVFTGAQSVTRLWNDLVPSNKGVTVVLDSPHCTRETVSSGAADGHGGRATSGPSEKVSDAADAASAGAPAPTPPPAEPKPRKRRANKPARSAP